jgi:hypothetical protein
VSTQDVYAQAARMAYAGTQQRDRVLPTVPQLQSCGRYVGVPDRSSCG